MRRFSSGALALVMAVAGLLSLSTPASANPIAGGGFSSAYAGESIFTNVGPGQSGQFSAIFFNDGTQPWTPGVVGLLVCASDKITCNVPANSTFAHSWLSPTVYASVTTTVAPGQNGFFIYNFDVPPTTGPGISTTFNGDVGFVATGALFRPEGYYQVNTTPTQQLTVVPSPASVQVGSTLQFTVSGLSAGIPVTWSVTGGCGAITTAGLFAATSMNSATQPCTVIASVPGGSGVSVVSVYGSPSSLGCSASPTTLIANGGLTGGTGTIRVSLKDANGNIVANASAPQINIANVTTGLATMTPTGAQTPSGGIVTVAVSTTNTPGDIQLSASAVGLAGCNIIITSTGPGPAVKTIGTFTASPIAADAISTSVLQIDVTDANGNRVIADNATNITITRDPNSANMCNIVSPLVTGSNGSFGAGSGIATVASGRVAFTVQATTTPGQCMFVATTNNSSIIGTSAAMQTQIVGAANKVSVVSNDQPHPSASGGSCLITGSNTDASCTIIVVAIQDANGATLTSDNGRTVSVSFDTTSCTTSGGGSATLRQATTTSQGRASFAISSSGSYSACSITLASAGLNSTQTTVTWTSGGADHLACAFAPNPIVADGASTSTGTVSVRDAFGNVVSVGSYGVSFQRTNGSATTLVNSSIQNTSNGFATFTVRSGTSAGSDTYTPVLSSGTLPHAPTTCVITQS